MENYNKEIHRVGVIEPVNPFNSDPTYKSTHILLYQEREEEMPKFRFVSEKEMFRLISEFQETGKITIDIPEKFKIETIDVLNISFARLEHAYRKREGCVELPKGEKPKKQVFTELEFSEYLMSKRETKIGANPSIK